MISPPWDVVRGAGAPVAVVDLDAFDANADALESAAGGVPLRVASKSVRVPELIRRVLARPGWQGVLAYSVAEAIMLARNGIDDVVVAYPSVDRAAIAEVAGSPSLAAAVTFMVDLPEHLRLLDELAAGTPLRVCLDIDCSLRIGRLRVGAHRSSLGTPAASSALARLASGMPGVRVIGLMFYEAQVAGVPDDHQAGVRAMKRASLRQLRRDRARHTAAVGEHARLEFVNGGGTGSLAQTRLDPVVTELAAGSGLFKPASFDGFDDSGLVPAAWFASPVVRKPRPDVAVTFSGGYAASGAAGASRSPSPVFPSGLRYFGSEGAGEVQTPLRGEAARSLEVGDLVWFRHTKAGEMCERFDTVTLVSAGEVVGSAKTYRGEGHNFG
ncbi:amino acid deaminase/aldolase [Calidifontibacter sp. DB0510]|uniref:Amino acid deaminase/aldolase n=1 Tax=Metallococcus carri TaxID=1656884 RepID=A0A967AYY5_9MICO|nr:alanine racemase [Metallococcus carri]NHN55253.1 amino acid deaminase/aldolase [Metallococcus carri]NOP36330.1 amino acid deaminase/aldolase [Calidifontibacter sp. DB2511S]